MAEGTPLPELFVDELRDIYNAENQLIKALPRMVKAATTRELKRTLEKHLGETRRQAQRLERIGRALDVKVTGRKCKGMEGLIAEGKELLQEDPDPRALDAGLIGAAQKVAERMVNAEALQA